MSVTAYPEYKESGVPWLGDVPGHWSLEPLRGQFIEHKDKNDGARDQNYLSLVAGRGVMPYAEKGDMGNKKPDDLEKCKLVKSGNFVINSMNFGIGAFGVSAYDGVCSPVYVVLEPSQSKSLRFLRWIFDNPGFREVAQSFGNGILAHRAAIGWDELKAMWIGVPPLAEQAAIAAFLDRETAKIDALVAEQEHLIALLKEKRQAVISHAVTKGFNPHAPMKDSGIEWLGEIPAHWDVIALSRLIDPYRRITYGIVQPGQPDPNGRFMIRGQDYSKGWADPSTVFRVSDEIEVPYRRARLQEGDIVMTIVGAGTGNTAVVPDQYDGANITQTTARIAPNSDLCSADYLTFALASWIGNTQVGLFQKGAAQPGLNLEHLKAFLIPVPTKEEQQEIAAHLLEASRMDDEIGEAALAAITLLQERRAALISAAVTGKIDVRGLVDASSEMEAT